MGSVLILASVLLVVTVRQNAVPKAH